LNEKLPAMVVKGKVPMMNQTTGSNFSLILNGLKVLEYFGIS